MIFNQVVVGEHPVLSGYKLNFFVNGFDSTFTSGSGQFTVNFPDFGIDTIGFKGIETTFDTGATLMTNIEILENEALITGTLTGDLNNSGSLNVKRLEVYTGSSSNFACDTINHSNRILTESINVEEIGDPFTFEITSGDINGRINENIFYKVVPADFLIARNESDSVSGAMGGDLQALALISGLSDFVIQRETATDLLVDQAENPIQIFPFINNTSLNKSKTTITVNDNVPSDFEGDFIVKSDGRAGFVIFTTESLPLSVSKTLTQQDGITKVGRQLKILNTDNEDRGFNLSFEIDTDGVKTALAISTTA